MVNEGHYINSNACDEMFERGVIVVVLDGNDMVKRIEFMTSVR